MNFCFVSKSAEIKILLVKWGIAIKYYFKKIFKLFSKILTLLINFNTSWKCYVMDSDPYVYKFMVIFDGRNFFD